MLKFLKNKYGIAYLFFQPISTALEVGIAYVMMISIDYATSGSLEKLHLYLIGFLAYIAIEFFVDLFTGVLQTRALANASMDLRNALMSKILRMNTSEYAKKNSGSYVAYMTKYVEKMDYNFFYKICDLYPQILQFLGSVAWLLFLDWRLAVFVLVIGSIQLFVPKFLVAPTEMAQGESVEAGEKYTIAIKEIFEAFDLIKSYNLQQKIEVLHKNVNKENTKKLIKIDFMNILSNTASEAFSNITYIGIFFLGAVLVLLGFFKVSVIIAASQLVVFIVYPLGNLTRLITSIFAARAIIKDLTPILNMEEKAVDLTSKKSFENEIVFENVSFAYPEESEDDDGLSLEETEAIEPNFVFSSFNLQIKKGEKILIVGKSGAGKSTLLSLLYKKFTGYAGSIKIDGVDIRNISDEDYFNLVSVVHQSPFIFDDTIKNNISLYSEFDENKIEDAVSRAGLQKVILNLPEKYETKIGESASKISGGEKQRLAIARALIKDTPILLLDEATSALDNETAANIENMLLSDKTKTCIIISHHVSDLLKQSVDRIITVGA
ncbi:ABC transporter ATP-binding protein [Treponema pedis]|uniref:ABC transporter ATP-binding protein n=1 Tax=Treponema pedis TaxID=409322 RepID=UPI000425FEE0|nr:ABC transporter ATP-binding protein [Treponema pedis]